MIHFARMKFVNNLKTFKNIWSCDDTIESSSRNPLITLPEEWLFFASVRPVSNLSQPGTFAGNDAIVAFARSQQVRVVIHQLNTPLWEVRTEEDFQMTSCHLRCYNYYNYYVECIPPYGPTLSLYGLFSLQINGAEKQVCRELHIAYRYGDHYDSVRRIGDNSESPAQLRIEVWDCKVYNGPAFRNSSPSNLKEAEMF